MTKVTQTQTEAIAKGLWEFAHAFVISALEQYTKATGREPESVGLCLVLCIDGHSTTIGKPSELAVKVAETIERE